MILTTPHNLHRGLGLSRLILILSKDFGRAQLIWVVGCCWNRQFRMTRLRDYEKKLRAVCQTAKNWAAVLL